MKKLLKFTALTLLAIAMAACVSLPGSDGSPITGTLLSYTAGSVTMRTLDKDGKSVDMTLAVNAKTVVTRTGQAMEWTEVAREGLQITVTHNGKTALTVQVPAYGLEVQGNPEATDDPALIAVKDVRVNRTDSSLAAPAERKDASGRVISKIEVAEADMETDTVYSLEDSKTLMLGSLVIDPASVALKMNGKAMKVIPSTDGKGKFAAPAGSSALLDLTKGVYTIKFDTDLGEDFAAVSKIVDLSFKKKIFLQTTTDLNYFKVNNKALVTIQGKDASVGDAMKMANYWMVRCNTEGEIIHINAYMQAMPAVVKSLSGKTLSADISGKTVQFALSEGVTLAKADGSPASAADFKAGAAVHITTEPADNFNVVYLGLK